MMKSVWAMIRLTILTQYNLSVYKHRYIVRKEKLWQPILFFLFLLFMSPTVLAIIGGYGGLYIGLAKIDQQALLLQVLVVAAQVAALFFGFLFVISNLYLSQDLESFLPLPVSPEQVLGARFVGVWISELIPLILLILPGFIVYGVLDGAGIGYYLGLLCLFPFLPVLPLALATLVAMLLMRVTNLKRNRDLLRAAGVLFGLGIVVLVQFMFRGGWMGESQSPVETIQAALIQFQDVLSSWFPQSVWVMDSLTAPFFQGGWFGWVMFIGISLLAVLITIGLGRYLLYPGVIGGSETGSRRVVLDSSALSAQVGQVHSPLSALFWREWKIFFRTPMFVINGLTPIVMIVVASGAFTLAQDERNEMIQFLTDPSIVWDPAVWIGASIVLLAGSLNSIASSSISREGKQFYISKMIPVPVALMVRAKWLFSLAISTVMTGLLAIVFGVVGVPVTSILWMMGIAICMSSILNLLGIMLDLLIPNLKWTNPKEAINKSYASLLLFAVLGGIIGILGGLIAAAYFFGLPSFLVKLIVLLLSLAANVGVLKGTEAFARKRYAYLEG